jgi:hypothetical protein
MKHTIEAAEKPLLDIFCDKYLFRIPSYQRPYAWTTEQTGELYDDVVSACGNNGDPASASPYFLGSIVLIKEPQKTDADVVDGQQRLTTLTILLSVLRDLADANFSTALQHHICQQGNPLTGAAGVFRLQLRERDAEFFQKTIQDDKATSSLPDSRQYSFRSFDRQWILPDNRLINRSNPTLWKAASGKQVYLTALMAHSPSSGPALTVAGLIPDLHHYKGSFGGRAFPLWADSSATEPNVPAALLTELSVAHGRVVAGPELFAYIAAIAASPAYTAGFRANLKQPGLRVPIAAKRALFDEAVALGREVAWLHTFGERFGEGRPTGPPRVDKDEPTIPAGGALPATLAAMPHELDYDAASRRLKIDSGFIAHVVPEVWAYEISGKNVLSQWWSYRRKDRSKPPMGDRRPHSKLSEIQPTAWPAEYTTELLALLRVTRLVALEPRQADLLTRIVDGPTIDSDTLRAAGSLSEASAEAPEADDGDVG